VRFDPRRAWTAGGGAVAAAIFCLVASNARAGWVKGEFTSGGRPVSEYHCVPEGAGPHPAVVMLHGASLRQDPGNAGYEKICGDLADLGYYTEFILYYSQTGAAGPGQPVQMARDYPIWLEEIHSGLDALAMNPSVDPHRIALMGFSLGSFLSLSAGVKYHSQIAAIVEYYGGLQPGLREGAKSMPPTLILHGDHDVLVPVRLAHELDDLLTRDNRPHQIKIYEGANHAFNFREIPFWYNADDAQDAWNRSVNFLAANLKNGDTHAASAR
jgi:carboxymethylenebutenolidase